MVKKSNKTVFFIILIIVLIQLYVTYFYTNTKEFSKRALIRNLTIGLSIYFTIIMKNIYILLIPIIIEIIIEFLKYKGYHMEKFIVTKYQYNDYWREINKKNPIFSNFTEGNYNNLLGFDTLDYSKKNKLNILNWSKKVYHDSLNFNLPYIKDFNGNLHLGEKLKQVSDNNKFKLISKICKINKKMRILEIGFGEGDFLLYIRNNYNINPIGVSISQEQVNLVKKKGFEAYCLDAWDIKREELGTFDLIIQCGNLEYIRCTGESTIKYEKFCKIIYSLLKPKGQYFVTCVHFNAKFQNFSLYDYINSYILWSGNDGNYPNGRNGFTRYAKKIGFKKIFQQDLTNDYFITTVIFMSYLQCMKEKCVNSISFYGVIDALIKTIAGPYFIHTYLCYSPTKNFYWLPWQWGFIPQNINNKLITPVTLEYILLQK